MSENIKVTFDTAEEDLHVNLDAGAIMYGKMQIGTTTTGESGTEAKVENVGSQTNAILNFTIPKGDKGEQGEKGEKGDTGSPVEVKDIPANTNVDEFFEEGTYAWNGDDGKAITGLPNDIVDMPSFSYMLKITKHSTMTNEKNKFEHYFQEFWLEGMFIYTRKITVRTGLETGRIFYERYAWERKALVNYDGVTVVSTEPTNETEKAKVWIQKGKNLFNKNNYNVFNGYIDDSTLLWNNNANGNFIYLKVEPNTTYTISREIVAEQFAIATGVNVPTAGEYATSFIDGTGKTSVSITTGENDNYLYVYVLWKTNTSPILSEILNSLQVELGRTATDYEENVTSTIYTKNNNNEYEKFSETVAISSHQPANQNGLWLQKGKNLISGFTPGLFYDYTNKVFQTGTPFSTSDFIDVEYGMTYTFSHALNGVGGYVGCFDENGNFLETLNNDTMLTPFTITNANCKKIICVAWDSNSNPSVNETWMQLEVGNTATEYEEYKDKKIYVKNDNGVYEEFVNVDEVKNDYSLAETKIGTWIDGKPLYRKVLVFSNGTGEATSTTGKIYNLNDFGIANADEIHFVQPSYYMHNGNRMPFPFYDGQTYAIQVYPTQLRIICTYAEIAVNKMVITLQYTKTTDVATTSLDAE